MKGENRVGAMSEQEVADIAASFQKAVIDMLVEKTKRAVEKVGAQTVVVGGGVAANSLLRESMEQLCNSYNPPKKLFIAPKHYCTDNAVMIASLAYHKFKAGIFAGLDLEPKATVES